MEPFSKRNKIKKEYSGYGVATIGLRNRLLQLHGMPYSGNEYHFGLGNTNWIHDVAFDKNLQMHFGKKIKIEDFRNENITSYSDVFDYIELYYQRAISDLNSVKRLRLFNDICLAFKNSGSVYEFNSDGQVVLKIDEKTANDITRIDTLLEPIENARGKFRNMIDGLIRREIDAADAVGDIYIVFEDYIKLITKETNPENAIKEISKKLHPIQSKLIENIKAYRGDVYGAAHAGKGKKPNEADALWYLKTFLAFVDYINTLFS